MASTIIVRDSRLEDLPEIHRIRRDPLVMPHQFAIPLHDDESWKQWIERNARAGNVWFRTSTILGEDRVIGYVTQVLHFSDEYSFAECGWNLDPVHWGRGVMTIALHGILEELFAEQKVSYVIADCFRNNTRCKRLLRKLNFSQIQISPLQRIWIAWRMRCRHWIERYYIDPGTWDRTRQRHLAP